MLSFKEFLLEFSGIGVVDAINDFESPPLFLNPKMIQRVFDIPDQHAMHGISIDNLMNSFPDVIGKAKAVSTFTHLEMGGGMNPFFSDDTMSSVDPDNPIQAFVLVKGRVTGKFNMDVYSAMLKGGRRFIMLNPDTIEYSELDQEHLDAIENLADDMRKYIIKTVGKMTDEKYNAREVIEDEEYPFELDELDNRQKGTLVKGYMDNQEKLMSSKKYKEALMHFMVLQKDKRAYGYNELTLDSVRPLAIYLKKQFSTPDVVDKIRSVREYSRLPIKLNVKETDIDRITKKMR